MFRRARSRRRAVAVAGVALLLAGVDAGMATAAAPPDSEPLFVIEITPEASATDTSAEPALDPTATPAPVIRPTPYVVAQTLVELEAGRSLQWQVHDGFVDPTGTAVEATANLFVFSDQMLAFASHSSPVASVLGAPDEVIAIPVHSQWTLRALGGSPAPATSFGVGHEEGGTAPAGEPFTVDVTGWYQLEVRAYQLLPGEIAEFGDGSSSTLLLVRRGTVTTPVGELSAGGRATAARGELINTTDQPAEVLAAAVVAVPAELAAALAAAPPAPASTAPPATEAPAATPAPTAAPTTTEAPRAPTAVNDHASSTGGNPASVNIFSNDDRGNPPATIVAVSHSSIPIAVGSPFDTGNGTVLMNADGTVTLTVANSFPGSTTTYDIFYTIENEHGSSTAQVSFSVEG